MKLWIFSFLVVMVVVSAVAVPVANIYATDDYYQTVALQDGIGDVKITIKDNGVVIDVTTTKIMSCTQIMASLELEKMTIDGVVYSPFCTIINSKLARIRYEKAISV